MLAALDEASSMSSDPPETGQLVVATRVRTGRRGRPKIHIDRTFLAEALTLRNPGRLAPTFNCGARSVRRRALEYGLVAPGEPVYVQEQQPDGTVSRNYVSSRAATTQLSDQQLDALLASILEIFPNFGRNMIFGSLKDRGHHVPHERIRHSFLRVHGSPAVFGDRFIHRKTYHVAGANSLWHHDGQHGM